VQDLFLEILKAGRAMADKSVTIRMDPDEYKRIEKLWERAGFTTLQDAGLHAYRTAFEVGPDSADVPARYRPYLKKLAEVLASGDSAAISAVVKNIDFFHDRMRPDDPGAQKRR
jgi:hypothetical protein